MLPPSLSGVRLPPGHNRALLGNTMDNESTSLDSLLNDEPAVEAVEAEPAQEPAPVEAPSGPVRDENGRFAAKETGVEDTGPPPDKLPQDEYKAIREEREKRQRLEAELDALRNTVQQLQTPAEPPAPPPSVWDDEQAYGGHIVSQAVQQATFNARLDMSEMMVRQANPDFDDMKAKFLELAGTNPALREQALADPHPWNKAYQIAKNAAAVEELGAVDLNDLRAKMRDELLAEMQAQAPVTPMQAPPSLTGERNVGARSGPTWSGPASISDLLR